MRMPLRQWMLAITKYADRLLDGLPALEWDAGIKALQRGWIGRSEVLNFQTIPSSIHRKNDASMSIETGTLLTFRQALYPILI